MTNKQTKKKLASRLYDAIFPSPPRPQEKREYAAARVSRLNAGWITSPTGANYERRISLSALIARSRQAARDDLHIVNYLRLMRSNVIGQAGIQLQSDARGIDGKTLDLELNKRVEEAWWKWSHAETCTTSGKLDWVGVQELAVTQCERDGAFLVQMVEADNEFGFALKTWDVTWLDHTYNTLLPNGNRIIMSVEVDSNDKPVMYWLTTPPSEMNFTGREGIRVRFPIPADQIIHGMLVHDDESAVHGVPGTAAALLPAKYALGYNEGVITSARVAANTFAILKNTAPDGEGQFEGAEDDAGNAQNPMINSSPLAITQVLPGWELDQLDPKQPTQNHAAFKQTLDIDIATALGVPHFLLMGDWTAVNYSSSRGGLSEFRERCKAYQTFISTTLCRRVYHKWLEIQFYNQTIKMTARQYRDLQDPLWRGRGWPYIDPAKDVDSAMVAIAGGLSTYTDELAEKGVDFTDFLAKKKSEMEQMQAAGVVLTPVTAIKVSDTGTAPAADSGTPPDTPPPANPKRSYLNGESHDDELVN